MKAWKKVNGFLVLVMCFSFFASSLFGAEERAGIRNKRVVFFFEKGFPKAGEFAGRSSLWYQECLKEFGVELTVAGAKEISDTEFLTKKSFDTLIILPGNHIPFESEYSILNFLSEGGNVITGSLPKYGLKYNSEKKGWKDTYGIEREFQIRPLWWKWAQKSLDCSLKINPDVPSFLLKDLPAAVGPFGKKTFSVLDKMNRLKNLPGRGYDTGDTDTTGGPNVETAANILFPLYFLPTGEGGDFVAYRYHSNYFNGSTLVLLGKVGAALMKSDSAKEILYACLKLCEIKLPGEEEPAYYESVIKLQREVSDFGKLFMETLAPLRDLTFKKFYQNAKEFKRLQEKMHLCENNLSYVMTEKQQIDNLLVCGSDTKEQNRRRIELLNRIEEEKNRFHAIKAEFKKDFERLKYPLDVEIKSPLGRIVIEAGLTYPKGLYMMRKNFFQNMKELGANVAYPQWCSQKNYLAHLNDSVVKKNRKGIKFDVYYLPDARLSKICPSQGVLNPVTGKVKETEKQIYDYELWEKKAKNWLEKWKGIPVMRYWTHGESVLGSRFWGSQAAKEYQEYLKKEYSTINDLNKRWAAEYKGFEEIELLTRMPMTVSEHSNWEDWINFREIRYIAALEFAYNTFKKYAPDVPVSRMTSTGSMQHPMYAANFYRISKTQDISGVDGTYGQLPAMREWIWFDLNCGKPFLTPEWGAFYGVPGDILEGRRKLAQGVWSEVSGGAVGINCWRWSCHGFPGNFVDSTGLPTLYGWELKSLVSDLKKFDHIILDGKRSEPEIRILFSDTSRVHSQSWAKRGKATSCPHVQAVNNLYLFFLRSHQPARVIAEEAFEEGANLSGCKLLIVPQAEYLSKKIQKKLLDYVKNGGNILLEGKSGKFDNYGHPENMLFKEAGVVHSFVNKKEILLPEGETFFPHNSELVFAPLLLFPEKGKILLRFSSGEPALVATPVGKGKILVGGSIFGLDDKQSSASLIMDEIKREINLPSQYSCSDKDLIIREWEYKGDNYLICVYPKGKDLVNKFQLKIKGNYKITDYLINTEVPCSFDGSYTCFKGLIASPGGRVYKLEKSSASGKSSVFQKEANAHGKEKNALKSNPASLKDSASLPYKGYIFAEDSKEIAGFLFQADMICSADDVTSGEAYLTISRGKEEKKRKLETGKEYRFFLKGTGFVVKCINCKFVFPLSIEVEIRKAEARPVDAACSLQEEDHSGHKSLSLSNGLVRIKIVPDKGGRIIEYSTLFNGVNHLAGTGITEYDSYPGYFLKQPFSYKIIKNTPEEIKVLLRMRKPVNNLLLEKIITLKKNEAKIDMEIKEYNYSNSTTPLSMFFRPELSIGGAADRQDRFFIPTEEGLKRPYYITGKGVNYFTPEEGWAGCCDTGEKIAYITTFPLEDVKTVYIWMGQHTYNLELIAPRVEVKSREALALHPSIFLIKGISGIDSFKEGFASHIVLQNTCFSQDKGIEFTIEIGSAFGEKEKLSGKIFLQKDGKVIKEIGKFNEEVSFMNTINKKFSFLAKDLPDGEYEILLSLLRKKKTEFLSEKKSIFLIGRQKERNLKTYHEFKQRLNQLRKKYPSKFEELFSIFTSLEEFRTAVEENKIEDISIKEKKIRQALEKYEN